MRLKVVELASRPRLDALEPVGRMVRKVINRLDRRNHPAINAKDVAQIVARKFDPAQRVSTQDPLIMLSAIEDIAAIPRVILTKRHDIPDPESPEQLDVFATTL